VKVVSESSIGSNIRRIEAITGQASVDLLQRDEATLGQIGRLVGAAGGQNHQDAVADGVSRKLDELKALQGELKMLRSKLASSGAADLAAGAVDGVVVAQVDGMEPGELRELALAVRQQAEVRRVVLLGETPTGGVAIVAAVESGGTASELIKNAARAVSGGAGGKGDVAQAGGKDPSGLPTALKLAHEAAHAT